MRKDYENLRIRVSDYDEHTTSSLTAICKNEDSLFAYFCEPEPVVVPLEYKRKFEEDNFNKFSEAMIYQGFDMNDFLQNCRKTQLTLMLDAPELYNLDFIVTQLYLRDIDQFYVLKGNGKKESLTDRSYGYRNISKPRYIICLSPKAFLKTHFDYNILKFTENDKKIVKQELYNLCDLREEDCWSMRNESSFLYVEIRRSTKDFYK